MVKTYSDAYLRKIKVKDNNERMVDVLEYVNVLTAKKPIQKIKRKNYFLMESAAEKLKYASSFLPKHYKFIIFDAYRDLKTQNFFFERHLRRLRKKFPNWRKRRLIIEVSKYVANPKGICPHMTGGAMDISLAYKGKEIDMGKFNPFKKIKLSKRQKDNRNLLFKFLKKAGFVNYPLEWWHWSYGDRYWAAVKKKDALYKQITKVR